MGSVDRINTSVSSKLIVITRSVSVIFDTRATYLCYSKKGYFGILKRRHYQEISILFLKALVFIDLLFSSIMSVMRVDL